MPDSPQNNQSNGYAKKINLLPEELQKEVKPSVSGNAPQAPMSKPEAPAPKLRAPKPPKKKSAWFKKLFQKSGQQPVLAPEKKDNAQVQFKASVKPTLDVAVNETPHTTPPPLPPKVSEPHIPKQPKIAIPEKPDSDLANTPAEISKQELSKPTPPPKVSKPEKKEQKKSKPEDKKSEKNAKHKHVSFSSIKDIIDSNEKEEEKGDSQAFGVDLIPSELRTAKKTRTALLKLVVAGIGSVIVVAGIYIFLSIQEQGREQEIAELEEQVTYFENEIVAASETLDQLSDFAEQTHLVSSLLQGQRRWTQLFTFLEENTIPEVYYRSVATTRENVVVLDTVARSYRDLARQYLIFESMEDVSELTLASASLDDSLWQAYLGYLEEQLELAEAGEEVEVNLDFDFDRVTDFITVNTTITFTLNSLPKL